MTRHHCKQPRMWFHWYGWTWQCPCGQWWGITSASDLGGRIWQRIEARHMLRDGTWIQ